MWSHWTNFCGCWNLNLPCLVLTSARIQTIFSHQDQGELSHYWLTLLFCHSEACALLTGHSSPAHCSSFLCPVGELFPNWFWCCVVLSAVHSVQHHSLPLTLLSLTCTQWPRRLLNICLLHILHCILWNALIETNLRATETVIAADKLDVKTKQRYCWYQQNHNERSLLKWLTHSTDTFCCYLVYSSISVYMHLDRKALFLETDL